MELEDDTRLAAWINEYWSSFAKTGKPLAESGAMAGTHINPRHTIRCSSILEGEQSTTVRLKSMMR